MRFPILAVSGLCSAALLAACAVDSSPREAASEGSYVTGSNIPRRDSRAANGVSTSAPAGSIVVPQSAR